MNSVDFDRTFGVGRVNGDTKEAVDESKDEEDEIGEGVDETTTCTSGSSDSSSVIGLIDRAIKSRACGDHVGLECLVVGHGDDR